MERGALVQTGTHAELMAGGAGTPYRKLVERQSLAEPTPAPAARPPAAPDKPVASPREAADARR
jgi:hypothetical protein